jgi:hypothetical protein
LGGEGSFRKKEAVLNAAHLFVAAALAINAPFGAGWVCFGLSPPKPNRRCKKCKNPSLTVSPALIESRESKIDQRFTDRVWGSLNSLVQRR